MSRDDFYFHTWQVQAIFTGIRQQQDYDPLRSTKYKELAIKYYYNNYIDNNYMASNADKMSYDDIIHEAISFGNIYFDELELDERDNDYE